MDTSKTTIRNQFCTISVPFVVVVIVLFYYFLFVGFFCLMKSFVNLFFFSFFLGGYLCATNSSFFDVNFCSTDCFTLISKRNVDEGKRETQKKKRKKKEKELFPLACVMKKTQLPMFYSV